MLSDAASWAAIIATAILGITSFVGLIFWMSAMYFNGRNTAKSVGEMKDGLENIWKFVRRKHRKSDLFRHQTNSKLKNHSERLEALEAAEEV